jgi:hypothetical protein
VGVGVGRLQDTVRPMGDMVRFFFQIQFYDLSYFIIIIIIIIMVV